MYFVYYTCTEKLRLSSRSWQSVLRILRLYTKVATFELAAKTPQTAAEEKTILTDTRA